jgi:hypothetical protein
LPNEMHTHNFSGVTTLNDGHLHHYSGVTGTAPNVPGHVHAMNRTTTVNDGHTHNYRLQTRQKRAIAGGHSHDYEASTSFTDGHNHNLGGTTSVYTDPRSLSSKSSSDSRSGSSDPADPVRPVRPPLRPVNVPETRRPPRRVLHTQRTVGHPVCARPRRGNPMQVPVLVHLAEKRSAVLGLDYLCRQTLSCWISLAGTQLDLLRDRLTGYPQHSMLLTQKLLKHLSVLSSIFYQLY